MAQVFEIHQRAACVGEDCGEGGVEEEEGCGVVGRVEGGGGAFGGSALVNREGRGLFPRTGAWLDASPSSIEANQ